MGETTRDLVRKVFPEAADDECGWLLWNKTGYPAFWATGNPRRDILHSLRSYKRASSRALGGK